MTEQKGYIKIPGFNLCAEGSGPGPARAYVKLTMILFPDITNSFPCSLGSWFPPTPACAGTQCKEIIPSQLWCFFPTDRPGDLGWGWSSSVSRAQKPKHITTHPRKWVLGWFFVSFICHRLGAAIVAKGSWGVHHHTRENGMKSTKIRKPIYNIIAVNY